MPAAPKPWEEYSAASSSASKPWEEYAAPPAAPAATGKRKPPSTADVFVSAPYEALAGLIDTVYGTPQNIYNLGAAAFGTGATMLGYGEYAPELSMPNTPVRNFLQQQGYIRDLSGMTPGQRVLNTGVQSVTGALLSPANSLPQVAANAVKSGVGGVAGELTSQATDSPLAGLAVALGTPGVITARQQSAVAARDAAAAQNAVRENTLRAGQSQGLVVPPGNVRPTMLNRGVEQVAGKTELEQLMSAKNQREFDRMARRSVGLADDADLTPNSMRIVRDEAYTNGYEPIAKVGNIPVDNTYAVDMQNIATRFTGQSRSFPNAVPNDVRRIINQNSVQNFDSADAIARIRSLRKDATAAFKRGDVNVAEANKAVAAALESQIERHLNSMGQPGIFMLADFRAARQKMAISHALEDAMREGTGSIDARKLAAAFNNNKAPLSGDLYTMATFANTFPKVSSGISGTPGVTNNLGMPSMSGAVGLGLGALFGGYQGAGAGALLGQTAPQITRAAAQRYLMSDMAQRNALAPRVGPVRRGMAMDPVLYNYLTGQAVLEP